jgi:hypothetical protein
MEHACIGACMHQGLTRSLSGCPPTPQNLPLQVPLEAQPATESTALTFIGSATM